MARLGLSPTTLLLLLLLDCRKLFVAGASTPFLLSETFLNPKQSSSLAIESTRLSSDYLFWVDGILWDLRGGARGEYDEDEEYYDEYDSEEEDVEDEPVAPRRNPGRNGRPTNRPRTRPGYIQSRPGKRPSSSSSLASASKLATKSLSVTGNLAWNALVKTPGKLAFHVIRPKHVDLVETFGLWRLDQQVVEKRGSDQRTITSVANVEFVRPPMPPREQRSRRGPRRGPPPPPLVVVRHSKGQKEDGKDGDDKESVYRAPYTFVRKNKYLKGASLSSFQTAFVAPAFLVGENQRLYGYKGTWQRKLADKSVIKLKGKIYQVHKQKFGKKRGEYVYGPAVGTFVMRRRISMSEGDYDDDADESDGDEYDDEEYDDDVGGEYDHEEEDEEEFTEYEDE